MKLINEEEYNSLQETDEIEKFTDLQKNNYLYIYSLYSSWFTNYLIKKINLKNYDDMVRNDKHHFLPVPCQNQDVYQLLMSDLLNYFYVRNTIHLIRLSKDEINFMLSKINNNDIVFDNEKFNFIEKTFQKVIVDYKTKEEKGIQVNYGPSSENFFAPNDSLVLGFRYDEFNLNGMSEDDWLMNRLEQYQFLENIFSKMEKDISSKLKMSSKIIQYDDYSINYVKDVSK